ncbi:MAG TPA: hypothetical protein VFY87_04105 [Geminicoccaceae bacterium]|nr:hypothetical protein [Geminicoccaceae bacterium]
MRQRILVAALLAAFGVAAAPAEARPQGWGAGYWSLPAGVRFQMSPHGVPFHGDGLRGPRLDHGVASLGRGLRHHDRLGRHVRGPVFISPTFDLQGFVVRRVRDPGFTRLSVFKVRRFDPVSRTVVALGFGDPAQVVVRTVPVPCFKPWGPGRGHGRFGADWPLP